MLLRARGRSILQKCRCRSILLRAKAPLVASNSAISAAVKDDNTLMNTLFESYYLLGLPMVFVVGIAAALKKDSRGRLLLLSLGIFGLWYLTLFRLQARSERILQCPISTTQEVTKLLGTPDFVHAYLEGDSDWVYTVRVWPWNAGVILNIYGNRVLAGGHLQNVDLLFRPEFPVRSEIESKQVKEFLLLNQK